MNAVNAFVAAANAVGARWAGAADTAADTAALTVTAGEEAATHGH